MDKKCVVAAFDDEGTVRQLIDILAEEDIDRHDISLVMANDFKQREYLTNIGPLHGANMENLKSKLIHVGLMTDIANNFISYVKEDGALIAVAVWEEQLDDIMQLLQEYGAVEVEVGEGS